MTITIRMNTEAIKCDANGKATNEVRPNVYYRDTVAEVVATGTYFIPNNAHLGARNWYVVEYGKSGGYSFVTQNDCR